MKAEIAFCKITFSGNQICVFSDIQINVVSCIQIYVFSGIQICVFSGLQRVEELEKDHARPQQNKHNPTFCLQGGLNFMIQLLLLLLLFCRVSVTLNKPCFSVFVIVVQGIRV